MTKRIPEGSEVEDLAACARSLGVVALYSLLEGRYVPYIVKAPTLVNRAFVDLFPHGPPGRHAPRPRERPAMNPVAGLCEACRDVNAAAVADRTLAAYLRLLCTSCLREIVYLRPSPSEAGRALRALQHLTSAATTELGRRILERDRV